MPVWRELGSSVTYGHIENSESVQTFFYAGNDQCLWSQCSELCRLLTLYPSVNEDVQQKQTLFFYFLCCLHLRCFNKLLLPSLTRLLSVGVLILEMEEKNPVFMPVVSFPAVLICFPLKPKMHLTASNIRCHSQVYFVEQQLLHPARTKVLGTMINQKLNRSDFL